MGRIYGLPLGNRAIKKNTSEIYTTFGHLMSLQFTWDVITLVLLGYDKNVFIKRYDPPHDKTDKMACAPSEDSDQPWHLSTLIRFFAARSVGR